MGFKVMPFIPHTEREVREMLDAIGVDSVEALFDEIPAALRAGLQEVPAGLAELEVARLMKARAAADDGTLCFIGAGAYEHHIPAAVWEITTRGEYYTAYTPYQAEASQGTLQLLYEYQTMMAGLTGMDVSNASLYDGASALAEAVLMAVRANRRSKSKRILMPATVHPHYRKVVHAIVHTQGIELVDIPYCSKAGHVLASALEAFAGEDFAALVIPQPNFFGVLEEVDVLTDWAHANGAPVSPGGPYFGFMCCRQEGVRQMPGRIVGRTVDLEGKPGFTLTLQAREQHIRRAKATSNICTNQGLVVTAATIYMSLVGAEGLARVAAASHANTARLKELLAAVPGVSAVFSGPCFHEPVLRLPRPADEVLAALAARGIVGGFNLKHDYPELGEVIELWSTETKCAADLDAYRSALGSILGERGDLQRAQT